MYSFIIIVLPFKMEIIFLLYSIKMIVWVFGGTIFYAFGFGMEEQAKIVVETNKDEKLCKLK